MFNLSPKWNFPSNNHSQIIGIADSGVEMFKGTPIKSLAREICQNSLDARLDNAHPARLEFETFTINPKTIPDSSNLEDAFERSRDFWKIQDSTQARNFFKRALKDMNRVDLSSCKKSLPTHIEHHSAQTKLTLVIPQNSCFAEVFRCYLLEGADLEF